MHNRKSAASFLIPHAKFLQLLHHNNFRLLASTSRSLLFNFQPSLSSFSSNAQHSYDDHDDEASSTVANVNEWNWKLSTFLQNEKDQEIVSRDKRDKRDYKQIAELAKRVGLYSQLFGNIVVASKVPLPTYRPDLDENRPQREHTGSFETMDDDHVLLNAASSTAVNVHEWNWKLSMLLQNEKDQEIVSRDKKDKRDFEEIAALAKRMGLYSKRFGNIVVVSKVPLPNYRPDLDEKRPQREVVIPLSLQRRVEGLVQEYLRLQLNSEKTTDSLDNVNYTNQVEDIDMDEDDYSFVDESVTEKVLRKRSLKMRTMQRSWQASSEGKEMLEFRKSLPAFKEKEALLQAIEDNQVVVISGETGCGKTTQVPQYLLESEIESGRGAFCSIICTQPRRISTMAVSERVSAERGESLGDTVGFKVRLEGSRRKNTHLLFCTSGILLRKLLIDPNLSGVTHVFVDEIHERGMNEDFLLIVLKDLLPHRPDLRLVLMSATLNADLFSKYFGGAPTLHIPGFTYPVREHFLEDFLEMTGYTLTSSNQRPRRPRINQILDLVENALRKSSFEKYSPNTRASLSSWEPDCIEFTLIEAVLCHICQKKQPGAVLVFMTGWEDIRCLRNKLREHSLLGDPSRVLLQTCHGAMETFEQKLIFDKPPPNVRKIVIATNVAEASITINDIVFIVDCGKAKETSYDALNNTPCLLPSWISQASARQRRGRAGRVQPGECYHLYPKCVYEAFSEYQLPEVLRTPLNSLCLQIKGLQVESIGKFLSSALQAPEPRAVQNAIDFLTIIGAFDEKENLTNLGNFLSVLPVDPKLGKMLIMGAIFRCFDPVLTIVASLSVRDPFLLALDKRDLAWMAKCRFSAKDYSDHMVFVRAYEGWKDAKRKGSAQEYCSINFLSSQTLQAIHLIRKQFSFILKEVGLVDTDANINNELSHNQSLVRAVICSGLFPGIASVVRTKIKTMDDGHVLLHASSVNGRNQTIPYPWLVFDEKLKIKDVNIRDSTGVSDSILMLFGGALSNGIQAGHLKMLDGYIDLFMDPNLADCYLKLKGELDKLIQKKLEDPGIDIHKEGKYLMIAVQELVLGDQCEGRFVFGRDCRKPNDEGVQFVQKLIRNKQSAERDAAMDGGIHWVTLHL